MYLKKTITLSFILAVLLVACLPIMNSDNAATPIPIKDTSTPSVLKTSSPVPTMLIWPTSTPQTLSSFPDDYEYISLNCEDFAKVDTDGLKPELMSISFDPVGNLYVYDPENGRILMYDTKGGYIQTIYLPDQWTEPLASFLPMDVPVFDNKIWFSTGIASNSNDNDRGRIVGTMDLSSGELGTIELPKPVIGQYISRKFFVDKKGMYVFPRLCEKCDMSSFFVTPDGNYFNTSGVIGSYYKDGFLFTPQDNPSAIIISKLNEEKKEFTFVKRVVINMNYMYISGIDQYNSMYIVLSPHEVPFYMAKISFNEGKKELFNIPSEYFSGKIKTDIFVADSGNIFILTIADKGTDIHTQITKCYFP